MVDFLVADSGVRQLQARYVDAVWRKDFKAFGDCFTADGEWRIAGQVLRGRAACVELMEKVMPPIERVYMSLNAPLISLEGEAAITRTYLTEMNVPKSGAAFFAIGVYYDRCVLDGDRWRFAWHHYQSFYHGPGDLSAGFRQIRDYGPPFGMPGLDEPAPVAGGANFGA